MYIVGFINLIRPRVLLNPVSCSSIDELYEQIHVIVNKNDFKNEPPITKERLEEALKSNQPIRVNFSGYEVALLMGSDDVIYSATDRFVHAELNT